MKGFKLLNSILIAFEIFLCGGGVIGFPVVFGHGEGDIYIFSALYIVVIIHILLTVKHRRSSSDYFRLPVFIFGVIIILFCLKATVWRGPEYPWSNGKIFFRPDKP